MFLCLKVSVLRTAVKTAVLILPEDHMRGNIFIIVFAFSALSIVRDLGILRAGARGPFVHELSDVTALRRNLDMCLERLPTLLNLNATKSPGIILLPTVLSQLRALSLASETSSVESSHDENPPVPETMICALQQASD